MTDMLCSQDGCQNWVHVPDDVPRGESMNLLCAEHLPSNDWADYPAPIIPYVPTTQVVKDAYVRAMRNAFIASAGEHGLEFERWLACIQADAYDHGVRSWGEHMVRRSELNNPYRRQENDDERLAHGLD